MDQQESAGETVCRKSFPADVNGIEAFVSRIILSKFPEVSFIP